MANEEEKKKNNNNNNPSPADAAVAENSSGVSPELENSPIPQVALTVPITDDPSIPVCTFRMWFLGLLSCILLSILNQFFWYRREPLMITSICAQVAVVPIGRLMARYLPERRFFKGTTWECSLNPGPFNIKEHVLITIFANAGAGTVYAVHIVTAIKAIYKKKTNFFVQFLVCLTTQVVGFGLAGIYRRFLVEPAAMWWPFNMVQVSIFQALNLKEKRPKGATTRNQFFLIALICSFCYYVIPNYLFKLLTYFSWVCWIFPSSVLAHQLGSGLYGLGIGSIGFDWATVSAYLGSPFTSPWFATANILVGYLIVMYVMTPITYWFNVFNAKTFPIFSQDLFTSTGQQYDVQSIINSEFELDIAAYNKNGPLYLSTFFAMTYGFNFAGLTATAVHVALFYGRDITELTKSASKEVKFDIHTRLMQKYERVPQWWFLILLGLTIGASVFVCEYFKEQLQLPWWGVLFAIGLSFIFTLPVGIIQATTGQQQGLNVLTEFIIGYLYPGRPVANMCFKVYGYISMSQALTFVSDFKLGHYMKIPPRAMFHAQVVGAVVSTTVYVATAWWLLEYVPNICDPDLLPPDSPWGCPNDMVFYDASVIWGLVGPRRIFGNLGNYSAVNWFFLAGAILPALVWLTHKAIPSQKWIGLINIPVIMSATAMMPPASSVNFNTWIIVAFISGFVLFRYRVNWWKRYNYVLSGSLDAGLAFMGVLMFFSVKGSPTWWGNDVDGSCPLATCPTQKGIVVKGCPVYH